LPKAPRLFRLVSNLYKAYGIVGVLVINLVPAYIEVKSELNNIENIDAKLVF
jgi:hypothetical protein